MPGLSSEGVFHPGADGTPSVFVGLDMLGASYRSLYEEKNKVGRNKRSVSGTSLPGMTFSKTKCPTHGAFPGFRLEFILSETEGPE